MGAVGFVDQRTIRALAILPVVVLGQRKDLQSDVRIMAFSQQVEHLLRHDLDHILICQTKLVACAHTTVQRKVFGMGFEISIAGTEP